MTKTEVSTDRPAAPDGKPDAEASSKRSHSVIDEVLRLLSSVRFGIIMLMLLLLCCMIGMFVMQQNLDGFREYYQSLTPSQRLLYVKLGFFDIYHSWYFTLLLAVTALNIILSSIERFPTAWRYLRKPRVAASPKFVRAQTFNSIAEARGNPDVLAEKIVGIWSRAGFRPRIDRQNGRTTVFAQRNVWNRFGAYAVHLALLLIFVGGFLTSRYGVGGTMEIIPGENSNSFMIFETDIEDRQVDKALLPFEVECTDLQQQLIKPEGGLDVMNTIDWLSHIRIKDGADEVLAIVHLNEPFDYRGYRFFQSSFQPQGYARRMKVSFEPADGGKPIKAAIERNGWADVEGIGRVSYVNFYPDFMFVKDRPATATGEYSNPVAELRIQAGDGRTRSALAFNRQMARQHPEANGSQSENLWLMDGYTIVLDDFEKVAASHTLTVQYDPGRAPVYAGFVLLVISLCGVFFFSHQRVWAVIEPDGNHSKAYFGGNTNRNRPAFESRFDSLIQPATGGRRQQ